jgi:hypothetical protein
MLDVAQKQKSNYVPVLFGLMVRAYKAKLESHFWYLPK